MAANEKASEESYPRLVRGKWFVGAGDEVVMTVKVLIDGVVVFQPVAGSIKAVRYKGPKGFGKIVYLRRSRIEPAIAIDEEHISAMTISTKRNLV